MSQFSKQIVRRRFSSTKLFDLAEKGGLNLMKVISDYLSVFEYIQLALSCKKGYELFGPKGSLKVWDTIKNKREVIENVEGEYLFSLGGFCLDKGPFVLHQTLLPRTIKLKIDLRYEGIGRHWSDIEHMYNLQIRIRNKKIYDSSEDLSHCSRSQIIHNQKYDLFFLSYYTKKKKIIEFCIDARNHRVLYHTSCMGGFYCCHRSPSVVFRL